MPPPTEASSSTPPIARKPIGEVILEFSDSGTYLKDKMETALGEVEKSRVALENRWRIEREVRGRKEEQWVKEGDVQVLTTQFSLSPTDATSLLIKTKGDLQKCLEGVISGELK